MAHGILKRTTFLVPDAEATATFYEKVFGWGYQEIPMGEFDYTVIRAGDNDNGVLLLQDTEDVLPRKNY